MCHSRTWLGMICLSLPVFVTVVSGSRADTYDLKEGRLDESIAELSSQESKTPTNPLLAAINKAGGKPSGKTGHPTKPLVKGNPVEGLLAGIHGARKPTMGRPAMGGLLAGIHAAGKPPKKKTPVTKGNPVGGLLAGIHGARRPPRGNNFLAGIKGHSTVADRTDEGDAVEEQPSLSPAECCAKWEKAKVKIGFNDIQKEGFVKKAGCPDFESSSCKSKEECCNVIWPTKKDSPMIVMARDDKLKISIMARKGCHNFDEKNCEPEEEEDFAGGSQEVVTFEETLTEGTWKNMKPKLKSSSNKLLKMVAALVEEEKKLHTIGSVIFDDTFQNFQTDGFIALSPEETSEYIRQWKELISPKQFKTLFGDDNMGAKNIGRVLTQPAQFGTRLDALTKLFVMLRKPSEEFWKDTKGDNLRWPTAMFAVEDVDGYDTMFPGVLDDIASTWASTCGSLDCEPTLSCMDWQTPPAEGSKLSKVGKRCVPRQAVSYNPLAGPLDKVTWGAINRQWRCLSRPQLLSQRAKTYCEVCVVVPDDDESGCAADAKTSFEKQQQKLGAWLHNRAITDCKQAACYDAKKPDWFEKLSESEKAVILNQASGLGDLDPVDVPGPLTDDDKELAAAKMAELKVGIDAESPFLAWLGDAAASDNFGGRFVGATSNEKRDVMRQVVGSRARVWKDYPQCPVGTTDCLGENLQTFLQTDARAQSLVKLYKDLERASIQWPSAEDARTATQILERVTIMSEEDERKEYKWAIDNVTSQSGKANGALTKVQKIIYKGI